MNAHPPAHEVIEPYHEDLSEGAVPKDHFIRMKFLEAGGRWIWRILAMLAVMLLAAILLTISYVGLGVIASLLLASGAYAHDAVPTAAKPDGWSYPFSCCSGYDCREVADAAISERPEGYVINGTGEVLGYRDARIKESPDGRVHWCSVAGADDGRTICLFIPPRSY